MMYVYTHGRAGRSLLEGSSIYYNLLYVCAAADDSSARPTVRLLRLV